MRHNTFVSKTFSNCTIRHIDVQLIFAISYIRESDIIVIFIVILQRTSMCVRGIWRSSNSENTSEAKGEKSLCEM